MTTSKDYEKITLMSLGVVLNFKTKLLKTIKWCSQNFGNIFGHCDQIDTGVSKANIMFNFNLGKFNYLVASHTL